MNSFSMLASSDTTVNITVDNETFGGEGRVKESGKWTDVWEDDWSKQ